MATFDVRLPLESGRRSPTSLMSAIDPKRTFGHLSLLRKHARWESGRPPAIRLLSPPLSQLRARSRRRRGRSGRRRCPRSSDSAGCRPCSTCQRSPASSSGGRRRRRGICRRPCGATKTTSCTADMSPWQARRSLLTGDACRSDSLYQSNGKSRKLAAVGYQLSLERPAYREPRLLLNASSCIMDVG